MKIKRTIDSSKATYDICELTRSQLSALQSMYSHGYSFYTHRIAAEDDELYNKIKKASQDDIKEF